MLDANDLIQVAPHFYVPAAKHAREVGPEDESYTHIYTKTALIPRNDAIIQDGVVFATLDPNENNKPEAVQIPVERCVFLHLKPIHIPQIPFCDQ